MHVCIPGSEDSLWRLVIYLPREDPQTQVIRHLYSLSHLTDHMILCAWVFLPACISLYYLHTWGV